MTRAEVEAKAIELAEWMVADARRESESNYLADGLGSDEIDQRLSEMDEHNAQALETMRGQLKIVLDGIRFPQG